MPSSIDPVAKAYAVIGLRPGCTARQLKKQYNRLAKIWLPDRWASDPIGQVEAAQRMRAINDAEIARFARESQSDQPLRVEQRLTDSEIDAIAKAIGNDNPFTQY